ncbi:MAG: mRNA surveillance protein pelota [Candidatus Aenigmarchaeota archaeon]|nr:mRNA surveillance protein pelota [Candidatus Aenigmarchaeota archaeon]
MHIIQTDLKHNLVMIKPETTNDLWLLEKMVTPGCIVSGKTLRAIKIEQGDKETKIKKQIFIKLAAEKIEFNEAGSQLRITGKILESSEGEHGYHTFEIMPEEVVTIEKEWKQYELERLKAAKFKHPHILLCVLDEAEADVAVLTERLNHVCTVQGVSGKSLGSESTDDYFDEIVAVLLEHAADRIVIAGPGFAKENMAKHIKAMNKELAAKITTDTVAHTGIPGIQEILRRGTIEKIVKHSALAEQTRLAEEFFTRVAKEEKVVYGVKQVSSAVAAGAVETLLVSSACVREHEGLMKTCEQLGGIVKIIDNDHQAGERFLQFGGIAALLRYQIREK